MIFISLPYMYENLNFNNLLKRYDKAQQIFQIPIEIEMCYGSLPFSYWNGDLNNNYNIGTLLLHNDIVNIFQNSNIPFCIDCSNNNLTIEDLDDVHQNIILTAGNSCGNYVEISDLSVLQYIKDQYKNYDFILSKNADLINPLTADIINVFLEQNIFYLINLPNRLKTNISELEKIIAKNKIIITIGNKCKCDNENYCMQQEQLNQINYSGYTMYNCEYTNNYLNSNELLEEIQYFQKLGFSHFKIDSPPLCKNKNFQLYLIENLVKSKYKIKLINESEIMS